VLKVLVVGGAGYIGAHCVRDLEESGAEVVVLDDLSTGHRAAVRGELIVGDVRDRALLRQVLSGGFDAVMHFAARALVGESNRRPLHYFDHNVAGTLALAREMLAAGVTRLVFSSSCSIYGAPDYLPVDELHPTGPLSPYGLSKLMAEQVLAAARGEGLQVTSLRYFNAAGARPDGALGESHADETHLIPLALQAAMGQRGPIQIFGRDYETPDGTCVRDYVHVQDLASAHRLAMDALLGGGAGDAYNLGTGRGTSVMEILEAVWRVTGRPVPAVDAPRRPGDPPGLWASADKASEELGWSPRYVSIEEIIETAWRWAQAPAF
jgi:UDP-glucose 4-epimerase